MDAQAADKLKSLNTQASQPAQAVVGNAGLAQLAAGLDKDPNNLDNYFNYAHLAENAGKYPEAEKAYKHMLEISPGLDRVKLDLALLYFKMGKVDQSKALFEEVRAKNIPDEVRKNIDTMLAKLNDAMKRSHFSGLITTGSNMDTNANSAASSGNNTISNVSIPLSPNSLSKRDANIFYAGVLNHSYRLSDLSNPNLGVTIESNATLYQTDQLNYSAIDLQIASVKTGPRFDIKEINTQVGFSGILTYVGLGHNPYIRSGGESVDISHSFTKKFSIQNSTLHEYRTFLNSDQTSTYSQKSGEAYQNLTVLSYILNERNIVSSQIMFRKEDARVALNASYQKQVSASYTHLFPKDYTGSASYSVKLYDYQDIDTSVSSTTLRHDDEHTLDINCGKKLPRNVTATVGYEYKYTDSTIENYKYADNKATFALVWGF